MWRLSTIVVLTLLILPAVAGAQGVDLVMTEDELTAWQLYQLDQFVSAREAVEEVLGHNEDSIVGRAVLGMIQRYGEGNLPRSLFQLRRARELLEVRFGVVPAGPMAAEWHRRIIQETAFTAAEMERFEEELELWDLYDRIYDPDLPGERIWPLMMLHRYDEARSWASKAISSGDSWSRRQAMNGLCALENEAGNRLKSYRWCVNHAQEAWEIPGFGGVYLCNAGEAARGLFKLDEAERFYLEATRREVEWYANPWMFLADLYVRAGRLAPAAQALTSMEEYNERRPPHTQQQDQSERHRTVAGLLIVAGRPEKALKLTERAVRYPDRRGGQSRSPEADLATNALLNRRALLDAAEVELERGSTGGLWERWSRQLRALWLRARAFRSGRRVVALMSDTALLRGLLEAEGQDSFGTPPWLVADLVDVVGPGPVEATLSIARAKAPREIPELGHYLDAYGADTAAARGDWEQAMKRARRAGEALPVGEALLRARTKLIVAQAYEARGDLEKALASYMEVLQVDPTLLRRTGSRLPVSVTAASDRLSQRTAALVRRSPRLRQDTDSPLTLQVQAEGGSTCHLCFVTKSGSTEGCATETVDDGASLTATARQCADLVHERLLAPQVDMSLLDPVSLDGATTSGGSVDDVLPGVGTPGS